MKKLLALYCLLCMVLSVSLFSECSDEGEGSFCRISQCRDNQSNQADSSHCMACTSHSEAISFLNPLSSGTTLAPVLLGEITFDITHPRSEKNISLPERPPCYA